MAENSVRISVRVDDDTTAGLARVRASIDALGRHASVRMRVHGSSSGRGFMGGLTSSLTGGGASSAMTSAGSTASGFFSRGITEGFNGGGLMSKLFANPYVAAATIAAGIVIGSALGAAIAGAVTLGFGAAFVGLGVYMIKDNAKVKSAWSNTIKDIKKQFSHAADGLIPVAVHAASLVGGLARGFAPAFKAAMDTAAPHLNLFLDRMAKGISNFGKFAFKPMMDAFNALLDHMNIEGLFTNLGKAFAYLGKSVQDNATQVGHLLNAILDLAVGVIYILGFLTNLWGWIVKLAKAFYNWAPPMIALRIEFALMWPVIRMVINQLMPMWVWFGRVLSYMAKTDGGGKIVRAALNGISAASRTVIGWLKQVVSWIGRVRSKSVNLTVRGVPSAVRLVQSLISRIRSFLGKSVNLSVRGVASAIRAVQSLINRIRGFVGKTVTVTVRGIVTGAVSAVRKILGFAHGGVVSANGYAHGGYVGKAAGGGPRSNRTLVGENGPEIVDLAPGSHVRSNPDSRRLMGEGSGGGGRVVLEFVAPAGSVEAALFEIFRKGIRVRGGNVQSVLGRN